MPDLSTLPPELIAPFAIVFALALLVSKIFDILEKWQALKSKKKIEGHDNQEKNETITPAVNIGEFDAVSGTNAGLTTKGVFLYSFFGAIAINVLNFLIQFIFIDAPEYLKSQLFNLSFTAIFGLASAVICAFFIKNKFPLISQNYVVTILMGFGVSAVLSLPVSLILTIVQLNKIYS